MWSPKLLFTSQNTKKKVRLFKQNPPLHISDLIKDKTTPTYQQLLKTIIRRRPLDVMSLKI